MKGRRSWPTKKMQIRPLAIRSVPHRLPDDFLRNRLKSFCHPDLLPSLEISDRFQLWDTTIGKDNVDTFHRSNRTTTDHDHPNLFKIIFKVLLNSSSSSVPFFPSILTSHPLNTPSTNLILSSSPCSFNHRTYSASVQPCTWWGKGIVVDRDRMWCSKIKLGISDVNFDCESWELSRKRRGRKAVSAGTWNQGSI